MHLLMQVNAALVYQSDMHISLTAIKTGLHLPSQTVKHVMGTSAMGCVSAFRVTGVVHGGSQMIMCAAEGHSMLC